MKNAKRFQHKHVFITGAARGIGYEIAAQFAEEGAILSLIDSNEENLSLACEVLKNIAPAVYAYCADVSMREKVFDIVSTAERLQSIDILINNAGIAHQTPFLEIEEVEWNRILSVNISGMFHVAQAVSRNMASRKQGVIVNMASKNGLDGEFGYAHYNVSKAGVIMLTKTMALELAHLGIRVNAVCPGYIETPLSREIDPPEFTTNFVDRYIPMNRPGSTQEVAPVFLFLASDESSFMTGQIVIVDGGQLAGQKPGKDLLQEAVSIHVS